MEAGLNLNTILKEVVDMKLTKIAVGIIAISIVFMALGPAMAVELKLGHYAPESHPAHQAALMMAKSVEARTNG